jgi:hypothetical protein
LSTQRILLYIAFSQNRKMANFGKKQWLGVSGSYSSCTRGDWHGRVVLGGVERSMQPGASIGFHRMSNAASDLRATYSRLKDEQGWSDEFAFASHIFERGEIAARDHIAFLLRRGVTPDFALRSLTYSSMDVWYPSKKEMLEAGVLTRKAKTPEEEAATR